MTHASLTSTPDCVTPNSEDAGSRSFESLRVTGFSITMAWHLLALFAVAPQSSAFGMLGDVFPLQLSLYASAALSFLLLGTALGIRQIRVSAKKILVHAALWIDVLACIVSALALFSFTLGSLARIVCFCALGVADTLFVTSALLVLGHAEQSGKHYRNIIMNAALGSLAAFAIMFVIEPLSWAIFCLLPLGSYAANRMSKARAEEEIDGEAMESSRRGGAAESRGAALRACGFGLALGLCQGAIILTPTALGASSFAASCGWVPLAGFFAALMLYLVPEHQLRSQGTSAIVRLGASLLLAGTLTSILLLTSKSSPSSMSATALSILSGTLALSGYCAFSLGAPATLLLKDMRRPIATWFGMNRFLGYASLALGLACGHLLASGAFTGAFTGIENASLVAVEAAGLIMCLASLPWLDPAPSLNDETTKEAPDTREGSFESLAAAPASASASPAVNEDVPTATLATAQQAASTPHVEGEAACERESQRPAPPKPERSERRSEEPLPHDSAILPTEAIARDFNLSRREHEILCYLAHGRNAAFIQRELLISIYTVKTHIANIYGKIGAHSMQDVIDLVEQYDASDELRSPHGSLRRLDSRSQEKEPVAASSTSEAAKGATSHPKTAEKDMA